MAYAPRARLWTVSAIDVPCVDIFDMTEHLRVSGLEEVAVIDGFIRAAQGMAEKRTQRLLTRRSVTLRLPGLPSGVMPVELPGGEVGTITSVTADGVAVTGSVAVGDSPALLLPATEWPIVTGEGYPVVIVYQAGFATVPEDIKAAVKLLAAELFERRSNGSEAAVSEVPLAAKALLDPWRIWPIRSCE